MKKAFLAILAAFCCLNAFAVRQDVTATGTVLDKNTSEPLEWVTIAVRDAAGSVIGGTTTDARGQFSVTAPAGSTITASLIGYKDAVVKPGKDLRISLEQDAEQLAAATVTEKVKLVEVKLDKVVMNVSQSAFAQGSSGLDLLKKAPGVTIDSDGNVKLNGKAVSVWVDGRPSHVTGKGLEALLRSTDGSTIDKFEIMEHPSSKYDAQGQGGIINIKTKRNFAAGFNGNIGINGGGMYFKEDGIFPWQENGWANLSYRGKKTNTFLNLSEGRWQVPMDFRSNVTATTPAGELKQETSSLSDICAYNANVKIGNDWFVDERNTIGVIFTLPVQHSKMISSPDNNSEKHFLDGKLLHEENGLIDERETQKDMSANLNHTHIFDPARAAEITTNVDYYHIANGKVTAQNMTIADAGTSYLTRDILSDNTVDIWSAKSDYQSLLWKRVMFEAGLKGALSSTGSKTDQKESGVGAHSEFQQFTYTEAIGAAYFNMAGQLGQKWAAKAGLRTEYTYSFGDWVSSGDKTRRSYMNLFPTAFIGFNPNEHWRFSLSYTRRINRPGYFYLNPNKSFIGSNSYTIGNPDLLPEFSDNAAFSVGYGQHLNLSLGLTHVTNWIMQNPYVDSEANQLYKWENFGTNNIGFTSLSISQQPIFKWLDWTLNLTGFYMAGHSDDGKRDTKGFAMQGYTCLTFNLPKEWKIEWDGAISTPMNVGYMTTKTVWYSNIGLRKNLMDGRMTLNAKLADIFRSMRSDIAMDASASGITSYSVVNQRILQQKLTFGISWNFGTAQSPLRQRNVGNLEEASRGKSSGSGNIGK